MVWQPATREIDPLQEAVVQAARATIMPLEAIPSPAPTSDGIRALTLPDGRRVRMSLTAQVVTQETRNGRPTAIYGIGGHVAVEHEGYKVAGQAVIDLATRAFLEVECRLSSVGMLNR